MCGFIEMNYLLMANFNIVPMEETSLAKELLH